MNEKLRKQREEEKEEKKNVDIMKENTITKNKLKA